jgi:hypothetical protein
MEILRTALVKTAMLLALVAAASGTVVGCIWVVYSLGGGIWSVPIGLAIWAFLATLLTEAIQR